MWDAARSCCPALQTWLCPHDVSCVPQPTAEGWLSGAGSLSGSAAYVLCMAMGRRRQRSGLHCSTLQHCLNKGSLSNAAPLTAVRCLQLGGEAARAHPHDERFPKALLFTGQLITRHLSAKADDRSEKWGAGILLCSWLLGSPSGTAGSVIEVGRDPWRSSSPTHSSNTATEVLNYCVFVLELSSCLLPGHSRDGCFVVVVI